MVNPETRFGAVRILPLRTLNTVTCISRESYVVSELEKILEKLFETFFVFTQKMRFISNGNDVQRHWIMDPSAAFYSLFFLIAHRTVNIFGCKCNKLSEYATKCHNENANLFRHCS